MKLGFNRLALAAATLAALSACDAKAPEPVAEAAAPVAATPPPPPPPLDVATALAAIDQNDLCGLFARASTDPKVRVGGRDCVVTPGATDIGIATKDGTSKLTVQIVEAGATVQLTPAIVSTQSVEDKTHGGFSNVGAVFIGRAPASVLCESLGYVALDGSSNSVFISTDPAAKGEMFDAQKTTASGGTATFAQPVVPAGTIGAFAVTRREPGMIVRSVSVKAC